MACFSDRSLTRIVVPCICAGPASILGFRSPPGPFFFFNRWVGMLCSASPARRASTPFAVSSGVIFLFVRLRGDPLSADGQSAYAPGRQTRR